MKRRRVRPSSQKMNMKKTVRGKTTITEKMFMVHGSWFIVVVSCCSLIMLIIIRIITTVIIVIIILLLIIITF